MEIDQIVAAIKAGPNDIALHSGAPPQLLTTFQSETGIQLPEDVKRFYQLYNGFESAEDLFRIIPIDESLGTRSCDVLEHNLMPN